MSDENNTIPFPPIAQREKLLKDVHAKHEEMLTSFADLTNEHVQWVSRINAISVKVCSTPEGKKDLRNRMMAVGLPYIKACTELGREVYGDEWNDDLGPQFMATIVAEFTATAVCPGCINGDHEPHIDDDEDEI